MTTRANGMLACTGWAIGLVAASTLFATNVFATVITTGTYFDDFRSTAPPCPPGNLCGPQDISDGGTTDGTGAFSNDGAFSLYELSHPLNSGDVGHDMALVPGQGVGYFLSLRLIGSGGTVDTDIPGFGIYNPLNVQPSGAPTGFGTPTIDGLFGGTEWSSAVQTPFLVDLPEGGTTPATLYLMNDLSNLYMAVRFARGFVDPGNSLTFEFDSNFDEVLSAGDDAIVFNPQFQSQPTPEPSVLLLLGSGLVALNGFVKKGK